MFLVVWMGATSIAWAIWRGLEVWQLSMMTVIAGLAILLHGSVSFIFSELAISRIVVTCRKEILSRVPIHRDPVHSSMKLKFLILGQAFVTALINLFAMMYFVKDGIGSVIAILVYSVVLMAVLGYLVLYRIDSSLRELHQAATNLREGSGALTYSRTFDSEFVDIVDGLNSATLAIQDRQQNLENRIIERTKEVVIERDKSEKLLLNILPPAIVDELKHNGSAKPVKFEAVTVIFTDFAGFMRIAQKLKPEELIGELDKWRGPVAQWGIS